MITIWKRLACVNERKKKVDFNENMFDNKNNTHSLFELNIYG